MTNEQFKNRYRRRRHSVRSPLIAALALSMATGCLGTPDDPFAEGTTGNDILQKEDGASTSLSKLDIVESVVEGRELRFYLAQPLTEAALEGVGASADWFTLGDEGVERGKSAATVRLGDDGFSLVLELAEAAPADATIQGTLLPADDGAPVPLATVDAATEFEQLHEAPEGLVGSVVIARPYEPFKVTSTTVTNRRALERDPGKVTIRFNKRLDCRKTPKSPWTISVYTVEPTSDFQQLMYHDPAHANPSDPKFRGQFECFTGTSQSGGRIEFILPGPLLGDAEARLRVRDVVSINGETVAKTFIPFHTVRPGLKAQLRRLRHNYSHKCDQRRLSKKNKYKERCDVYLAAASYNIARNLRPAGIKIPSSGDYGNFAPHTNRYMNYTVYESRAPIPKAIALDFAVWDHDDDEMAKKVTKVLSTIHTVAGDILAQFGYSEAKFIAEGANKIMEAIRQAASSGPDDFLGEAHFTLDRYDDRWGTQRDWNERAYSVFRNKGGKMNLYIKIVEDPESWNL